MLMRDVGLRRRKLGRVARALAALSLVLALSACASLERVGVPPLSSAIPVEAPKTLSIDSPASLEAKRLAATFGGEYRAPAAEAYLNAILEKLAQASETPGETVYKVTILNSPVINAFALASGNLFVTRGLLALANDNGASRLCPRRAGEGGRGGQPSGQRHPEPAEGRGGRGAEKADARRLLPATGTGGGRDRHSRHRAGGL
jgi:hypothetical protein